MTLCCRSWGVVLLVAACASLSACAGSTRVAVPNATPEQLWESTIVVYERYAAWNPNHAEGTWRSFKNSVDPERRRASFVSSFLLVGWVENRVQVAGDRNGRGSVICVQSKARFFLDASPHRSEELEQQLIQEIINELEVTE